MASEVPRVIGDNAETRRFLDSITRDLRSLQSTVGGISPAPPDASYVTLGTNATLSAERVLTAGTGISFTDGGAGSTLTVASTVTTGGLTVLSYAGAVGTGSTYSVTGLGGYKMFIVALREVSHNSGSNQSIRVAVSGNAGSSYGSPLPPLGATSFAGATAITGVFFITNIDQTNNQTAIVSSLFSAASSIDTSTRGPIDALQFSWSGGNFDNGSVDIYGLK